MVEESDFGTKLACDIEICINRIKGQTGQAQQVNASTSVSDVIRTGNDISLPPVPGPLHCEGKRVFFSLPQVKVLW
jgi:hypothetical protein